MRKALVILALLAAPAFAQSGDTAANMSEADIRSRAYGTNAGALGVSASSAADLDLINEYLLLAQKAKKDDRHKAVDKHLGRGVKLAERLTEREPEWPAAWLALARIRVEMRGFREALVAYQAILKIDPESEQAKAGVRSCEWQIENGGS